LVEKVTIGVDDVWLRKLSLNERNDMREFMLAAVCTVGDCVHGGSRSCAEGGVSGADLSFK
jgi:hypothetical protein